MNPKLPLKIASGLLIFHLLGHTFGHINWKSTTDSAKKIVIDQMTIPKFQFMGTERALGDYYDGYGYCASIALLFFGIMLWLISNSLHENKKISFKIIMLTTICLFLWSIVEFLFFFPFAGGITLLAAISTLISITQFRNNIHHLGA